MKVEINEGIMTVEAENETDQLQLVEWAEQNHNALCNYALIIEPKIK